MHYLDIKTRFETGRERRIAVESAVRARKWSLRAVGSAWRGRRAKEVRTRWEHSRRPSTNFMQFGDDQGGEMYGTTNQSSLRKRSIYTVRAAGPGHFRPQSDINYRRWYTDMADF